MLEFLHSDGLFVAGVAAATFLYLLIDLFIVVKNFAPIVRAPSFWFFWLLVSILSLLAFEALWLSNVGQQFGKARPLALITFSTFATVAVLRSFALKIGDSKLVDVSTMIEISGPLYWRIFPVGSLRRNANSHPEPRKSFWMLSRASQSCCATSLSAS